MNARWVLATLLLASCGATAEQPAASASSGEELALVPLRIGIPVELRPEYRSTDPTPDPEAAEPEPVRDDPEPTNTATSNTGPSGQAEVAGWEYLREARRHVAHTYRADIQRCFDEGYTRSGPLAGRLVVAMVPHSDGRVASSRVVENGTADVEVGECVMRAARAWELPPPPRRTLEVQLRFTV